MPYAYRQLRFGQSPASAPLAQSQVFGSRPGGADGLRQDHIYSYYRTAMTNPGSGSSTAAVVTLWAIANAQVDPGNPSAGKENNPAATRNDAKTALSKLTSQGWVNANSAHPSYPAPVTPAPTAPASPVVPASAPGALPPSPMVPISVVTHYPPSVTAASPPVMIAVPSPTPTASAPLSGGYAPGSAPGYAPALTSTGGIPLWMVLGVALVGVAVLARVMKH